MTLGLPVALPFSLALLGLVSGVHCVGMCGGIVAAYSAQPLQPRGEMWKRQLAFNLGRISSYAAAGAAAGALGGLGAYMAGALPIQSFLYLAANLVLVATGLYFLGAGAWLSRVESLGAPLWRRIQPFAARALQARAGGDSLGRNWFAGVLWGWLPCSLVYGALAASVFAGGPLEGAAAMLGFGLGTLPNLMAAGYAAGRLQRWMRRRAVRAAAGSTVIAFGAWGLAHGAGLAEAVRRGLLCL